MLRYLIWFNDIFKQKIIFKNKLNIYNDIFINSKIFYYLKEKKRLLKHKKNIYKKR